MKVKCGINDKKQRKFYAISNKTSIHTDLTWFSFNKGDKGIFQNSEKLSPVFNNIHDSFFLRQLN